MRLPRTLLPALLLAAFAATPARAQAPAETIVILDMSGSMWGRIGEETKLEIARTAVRGMFSRFPQGSRVGLMAYGHRRAGDCRDIQLLLRRTRPRWAKRCPASSRGAARR